MKARDGFGKDSSEGPRKFFRDRKNGRGPGGPVSMARLRKKKTPWHLDRARGTVEGLWKEYERLMEEYMELLQRFRNLEGRGEGTPERRQRALHVRESPPGWGFTPCGKRDPPGTDGGER